MTWDGTTATWWINEVSGDPSYGRDVDPLFRELTVEFLDSDRILDLGCGDGRVGALVPGAFGVDGSIDLVRIAAESMSSCVGDVSALPFAADTFDHAYAVLVIEHVSDPEEVLAEAARIVRPGGTFSLILNHPMWTAPGSGPFVDPQDGEVLWRWGGYLERGHTDERAGPATVRFHHLPLGDLLTSAANAGWHLEVAIERTISGAGDTLLEMQEGIPRLMGVRWRR